MRAAFAIACSSVLLAGAAHAAPAQVTASHPLIKIRPTDEVPGDPEAQLAAAANEMEGFQAVVQGGDTGISGVSAYVTDLQGPTTIPSSQFVLYRQGYMEIRNRSDANGLTGRVPDALIPDVDPLVGEQRNAFPFDVPAGENRVLWVDLHIPSGTPSGIYRGSLEVVAQDGFAASLPIELEVFPFELPSTPTYHTAFGLGWAATGRVHCGEAFCNGNDEIYDGLRQLYAISALDNRISLSAVAGPGVQGKGGNLDFSRYDRANGPLLDGTAATRLPGAKLTSIQVWLKDRTPENYAAWAQHFESKGWFDRLFDYTCDEPPLGCGFHEIAQKQSVLHAGDPRLRSLVTTSAKRLQENGAYESTDLIVPVVNFVEGKSGDYAGDQSLEYQRAREDGKTTWIYSSCMSHGCGNTVGGEYGGDPDLEGWPSLVIDHSALRNRAMPWVAYRFGFTGELYWETVWAYGTQGDPWTSQWDFTGNGDGTLFYPGLPQKIGGTTHIPIESLRLKHIRDGVEDYEYIRILESLDPSLAEATVRRLFPHAWSAGDMQPEQMLEVRRELARAIADAADRKGLGNVNGPVGQNPGGGKPGSGSAPGLGLGGGSAGGGASSDGSSCSTAGAQGRSLAALLVLPLAGLVSRRRRS
jgi:hypothetical protein